MSRSFHTIFNCFNKALGENLCFKNNNKNSAYNLEFFLLGTLPFMHGVYALNTENKEKTVIVKKYKMVRNGFTDFMVIDNKDRHFNVNNSVWYWKWNSVEDWNNIKEGNEIRIKYYGWRVPILGLFPNIYMSSTKDFLDSMNTPQFIKFESDQNNNLTSF
jgi:hypothetical protein